jgi:hypothetical protein
MNVTHTMFQNGAVRNASGVLVAFYDREIKELNISGKRDVFFAADEVSAMELVAENV